MLEYKPKLFDGVESMDRQYKIENISEKNLLSINQVLTNNNLSLDDKKNAFSVIVNLEENYISSLRWNLGEIVKQFCDFCLNEKISSKDGFFNLLSNINKEFDNIKESSVDNKREKFQLLGNKILTVICIGMGYLELKDDEYFNMLNKILSSNVHWKNYDFMRGLFSNEIMQKNPQKLKIAFEVALTNKVDVMTSNSNLYPYVWSLLTNSDVLSLDDETYKKVVEIAIYNIQSYVLDVAMKKDNLTLNKKTEIVNYYQYMIKKHLKKYLFVDIDTVKKDAENKVFSLACCERLASMSDEDYASILNVTRNSSFPISCAKVLANEDINEEQRKVAMQIINGDKLSVKERETLDREAIDYKNAVAMAAISPVLTSYSIEDYSKILKVIEIYCKHACLEKEDFRKKYWYLDLADSTAKLLYNTAFIQNKERLLTSISSIVSENRSLVGDLTEFCSSPNSAYYSDEEYSNILDLINHSDKPWLLVSLFTNDNVPFMEDKTELFSIIYDDEETIKSATEELNRQGKINRNLLGIFNGVDGELQNQILDSSNSLKRVQKQNN